MPGLACIIAGVVGGLGQTGVAIANANTQKREELYANEQKGTLDNMFADAQVKIAKQTQLANTAAALLQQAQAGQVAQKQAASNSAAKIILYSVVGLVAIGTIATVMIYKRRSAARAVAVPVSA